MQTEPPKADPPKRKRRWFQFSLRTMMVFVTLLAIPFGYVGVMRQTIITAAALVLLVGLLLTIRESDSRSAEPVNSAAIERVVEKAVSINAKNRPLKEVTRELEKQCSRRIAIHWIGLTPEPKVSIDLEKAPFMRALAGLSIASNTPLAPIGGRIGEDDRQETTFWDRGFRIDHYLATNASLILEREERQSSGNAVGRYFVLDVYGFDNELWDESFDVHLKESKTGRVVPVKRLDIKELGKNQDPGLGQWYSIPTAEIGRADAVGGTLHGKSVSPLLKATIPLALDGQAKGEGFVATVVRIDRTKDPSAEILIVRDDGRTDFRITDVWLLDAGGVGVRRGRTTYTYDSKLKTRAEVWAKDLAHASTIVVKFGMEKCLDVPFEFPLSKNKSEPDSRRAD